MIPAFSLERTQRILYQINDLVENGRIPKIKIFLDSPLSIKATGIYKNYANLYNAEAKNSILKGDDLLIFPGWLSLWKRKNPKNTRGRSAENNHRRVGNVQRRKNRSSLEKLLA